MSPLSSSRAQDAHPASDILVLAVWFGIVCGLCEGAALLALQKLGWLNWNIAQVGVSVEIIWVSALFNVALCMMGGVALCLIGRASARLPALHLAAFGFALFAFLDLLLVSGRIRESGALILAIGLSMVFLRWFRRHQEGTIRFWRRTLPWATVAILLSIVGIEGGTRWLERRAVASLPKPDDSAPNILVIVVDTLRADHMGAYGYSRATSPNMDRLAREGVLFENAIATSSWTLPSHASMLTGLYPYEHGAVKDHFPDRHRTLPQFLRERGYRTGAISANTIWFARQRGFGRGFVHFEDFFGSVGDMFARTLYGRKIHRYLLLPLGYEDDPGRKRAPGVTGAALRWIGTEPGRPFFLFLNYYDPHDPYLPPPPYRSRFSKRENPGGNVNSLQHRYYPALTPEQLQDEIDAYDGSIAYADHHIGELLNGLKQRGLAGKTLIILVSDHGESFGEHGLMVHINALYRETLHVPLVFWWPGHLPAGSRVAQPVSIAALPATTLELSGEGSQETFPGPSLAQLWQEPGTTVPDYYPLAELAQFKHEEIRRNPCYSGALESLVSSDWQYITHEKLGEELYEWRKDPQQLNNLARTPEGQTVASAFAQRLRQRLAAKHRADN